MLIFLGQNLMDVKRRTWAIMIMIMIIIMIIIMMIIIIILKQEPGQEEAQQQVQQQELEPELKRNLLDFLEQKYFLFFYKFFHRVLIVGINSPSVIEN